MTHAVAALCTEDLRKVVHAEAGPVVVTDASALREFDSSALAVLLECRREALALGKTLAVQGLPERLRQLAQLYGVAELMPAPA